MLWIHRIFIVFLFCPPFLCVQTVTLCERQVNDLLQSVPSLFLLKSSLCTIASLFHVPQMNNWGLCTQTHHYGSSEWEDCLTHLWRSARMFQWDAEQGFHAFKCSVLGDCDCRAVTAGSFWGALSFCRTVSASNGWEPSSTTHCWMSGNVCWTAVVLTWSSAGVKQLCCFYTWLGFTLKSTLISVGLYKKIFANTKHDSYEVIWCRWNQHLFRS